MKDREIDFARLTAQTEKMSVKSACDVRIEILVKEKEVLIDEIEAFKDRLAMAADDLQLAKIAKATDPEKESLRQQIIGLQADSESKQKLREENQALYEKMQTLNAKINLLVTENHHLKDGQREAIAEASKPRRAPELFFKQDLKDEMMETQIKVMTSPKDVRIDTA